MNERIRELAREAEFIVGVSANADRQIQKLVESVVIECAKIADEPTSRPFTDYGEKIKQHFGVK